MLSRRRFLAAAVMLLIPKPAIRNGGVYIAKCNWRFGDTPACPVDLQQIQDFQFFFRNWLSGVGPPKSILPA
jgi:hypothetical protein